MASAEDVADLKTSRSNLIAVVKAQTAAWVAAGCPPTFSVDGESYDWNGWLESKTRAIEALTELISRLSAPWVVRSRGRA